MLFRSNCRECTAEKCTKCEKGFINFPDRCIPCEYGCVDCIGFPNNCTSCIEHYKLDMVGECFFRFTIIGILGLIIVLIAMLVGVLHCLNSLRKSSYKSGSVHRDGGESILGDEFKQAPTLIHDVTQIGRQSEIEKDLSLVMDSQNDAGTVNSNEDSIRVDIFEDRSGRNSNISHNKSQKPGISKKDKKR